MKGLGWRRKRISIAETQGFGPTRHEPMSFGKMEADAFDRMVAFPLQDSDVDAFYDQTKARRA